MVFLFRSLGFLASKDYKEEFEDTKRDNQNPYIEEEQRIQWPKEKVQKDKNDLAFQYFHYERK